MQSRHLRVGVEADIDLGAATYGRPVDGAQRQDLLLSRLVAVDEERVPEPLCLHPVLELRGTRNQRAVAHRFGPSSFALSLNGGTVPRLDASVKGVEPTGCHAPADRVRSKAVSNPSATTLGVTSG